MQPLKGGPQFTFIGGEFFLAEAVIDRHFAHGGRKGAAKSRNASSAGRGLTSRRRVEKRLNCRVTVVHFGLLIWDRRPRCHAARRAASDRRSGTIHTSAAPP